MSAAVAHRSSQLSLFDGRRDPPVPARWSPRRRRRSGYAARESSPSIPRHNVVLEASAGTGKTSVLVVRYINLLKAGVDPANILAMTFTRKAAAEMRERIIRELQGGCRAIRVRSRAMERAARSPRRHRDQHDRRVLPVAAARISARGGPRSRLRAWRTRPRCRGSSSEALDRSLRIFAAWRRTSPTSRWCSRSSASSRTREGLALLLIGGSSRGMRSIAFSRAAPPT